MSDPVIRSFTDKFIEIVDSDGSSVHVIRLDSIMHVRSSYRHAFIGTNTLHAAISFTFKDASRVPEFVNDILAAVATHPERNLMKKFEEFKREQVPQEKLFQKIEQNLMEKFEEFKREQVPQEKLFQKIEQNLMEKFEELKSELSSFEDKEEPPTAQPLSSQPLPPMFPVAETSGACEVFIMLVLMFLVGMFILTVYAQRVITAP